MFTRSDITPSLLIAFAAAGLRFAYDTPAPRGIHYEVMSNGDLVRWVPSFAGVLNPATGELETARDEAHFEQMLLDWYPDEARKLGLIAKPA